MGPGQVPANGGPAGSGRVEGWKRKRPAGLAGLLERWLGSRAGACSLVRQGDALSGERQVAGGDPDGGLEVLAAALHAEQDDFEVLADE